MATITNQKTGETLESPYTNTEAAAAFATAIIRICRK